MIMALISSIEDIPMEKAGMADVEVTDTYIQWLLNKERDGVPNFAMRRFVMKPGGTIGLHHHPNEHEIYIIGGEGIVYGPDLVEHVVRPGNFLYVPPDEPHGYRNDGSEAFVFLCMVPNPR